MPSVFVSHGAPNIALYDSVDRRFFDGLAARLPRPRAILVASAHYAAAVPAVTASAAPPTIHDFYGFEEELYKLRYPAPGAPDVAARALSLLETHLGVPGMSDHSWGFDHGAWSPLIRVYPQADIPLAVLSLKPDGGARWHYRVGQALAPLRDEGVLVLGSGSMTHNLGRLRPPAEHDAQAPWVTSFLAWVDAQIENANDEALCDYLAQAPHARDCHPTDEHFMPLFVALGAAGPTRAARRLHRGVNYGTLAMDAWRFD
jgi:4,5-DOPA dioxygenase extradiol